MEGVGRRRGVRHPPLAPPIEGGEEKGFPLPRAGEGGGEGGVPFAQLLTDDGERCTDNVLHPGTMIVSLEK